MLIGFAATASAGTIIQAPVFTNFLQDIVDIIYTYAGYGVVVAILIVGATVVFAHNIKLAIGETVAFLIVGIIVGIAKTAGSTATGVAVN